VKKTLAGESRTADTERVDWKNDQLMEETKEYDLCDIYTNAYETRQFPNLLYFAETTAMVEQSKQQDSGVPYMCIVLVVVINYRHLLLANIQVHGVLRC
jgi:hypothetical protein